MVSTSKEKKSLRGKDLITIGIFSAIYFVINFVFMITSGLSPYIWILYPGILSLFTGIPFMIMVSKVQKPFAVFIMGFITAFIYFATGQISALIILTFILACIFAEAARFITKYKSFAGNTVAFVFFSLGMTGSPLPIWLFKESFFTRISKQGMPEAYVSTLKSISSPTMLVVMFAAPVIGGIIGSLIAKFLFKKHFEKAGIV